MFIKNFKVKTSTAIRGSDRRKLRIEIEQLYPHLTAEELMILIPNKTEMNVTKITTNSGEMVVLYCVLGEPVFFEFEKKLYPTVYTLWKYPGLVKLKFHTWPAVLEKLASGADLMLPGVVLPFGGITSLQYFEKDEVCIVMLKGNQAPVAVGLTMVSRKDLLEDGLRGKGVKILHVFTDFLWAFGSKTGLPQIDEVNDENDEEAFDKEESKVSDQGSDAECVSTDQSECKDSDAKRVNTDQSDCKDSDAKRVITDQSECKDSDAKRVSTDQSEDSYNKDLTDLQEESPNKVWTADELLEYCFFCAALRLKDQDFPLLTSNFFRNHMIPYCPDGETLDLKKSSYKKLSSLLQSMQDRGTIVIQQLSKGVDSITAVNFAHNDFKSFKATVGTWPPNASNSQAKNPDNKGPIIEEMVSVSGAVVKLFADVGYVKGTIFNCTEARKIVTEYVKKHDLVSKTNQRLVLLDPIITKAIVHKNEDIASLPWDSFFTRILGKMNSCYQITLPGKPPVVRKGKIDLVEIVIEQRMGNKKVTLVRNLDVYGIDSQEFAHKLQLAAASSTSVSQLPGKSAGNQVLVQGNQVRIVASSLIDDYKIPRKYISGLELLKNTKKKK